MKPIIIDAATIFDAPRLLAVLASVDIRHSEVWVSQQYDHFKEKDFITGMRLGDKFGLLPDEEGKYKAEPLEAPKEKDQLDSNHWLTGPKILRWALEKGLAVPKDFSRYDELAKELAKEHGLKDLSEDIMLGAPHDHDVHMGKEWTETYLKATGQEKLGDNHAWRLVPYGSVYGLGYLLAAKEEAGAEAFLSHPYFSDSVSTHNYNYYNFYEKKQPRDFAIDDSGENKKVVIADAILDATKLVESPKQLTIGDVAFFLQQKERIDLIQGILNASKELETTGKDVAIMTGKFVGSLAVDVSLFAGLPVASGVLFLYEVGTRVIRGYR